MHSDAHSTRYVPTSPLAERVSAGHSSVPSHSSSRNRSGQPTKQSSRSLRLDLSSYPAFSSRNHTASPVSVVQSPAITLNRGSQPAAMESPRAMREKQKELIARAQLSSKLAASAMSVRPEAPRLDPLGSPKGAVTPLTLEEQEAMDYFTRGGAGRFSPVASPSARSSRSSFSSGKEESIRKTHSASAY